MVRRLVASDTTSDALAEFLELLDGLDLGAKNVYLDRGFYNSTCLTLLYTHNCAYVMPIVSGNAVGSAAVRRRQRLFTVVIHLSYHFEN